MQKQNRAAFVLLGINLLTLILLGCVNSVIGQHGVFLYLPALFFLPGALCLDNSRGIPLAFVTGLLLDQQIETSFGFHAFALSIFHLLSSNWLRGVNYRKDFFTLVLQLPANLLFFVLWLLWVAIFESNDGMDAWQMVHRSDRFDSCLDPACRMDVQVCRIIARDYSFVSGRKKGARMKLLEKHLPEKRRLWVFKFTYGFLFLNPLCFLIVRQTFETEDFENRERIQGQRRILRPGARGDVLDRNGQLLIGNKAHFSAVLQLEYLKQEIWEERISLGETAQSLIQELLDLPELSGGELIGHCIKDASIRNRGIIITGKSLRKGNDFERTKLFFQKTRVTVNQTAKGFWHCLIKDWNPRDEPSLRIEGSEPNLKICVPGLFTTDLFLHRDNRYRLNKEKTKTDAFSFLEFFDREEAEPKFGSSTIKFEQNDGRAAIHTSIEWEARYKVVQKYQKKVNRLTGRDEIIPFRKAQISLETEINPPFGARRKPDA